jgi:hypothetical protein
MPPCGCLGIYPISSGVKLIYNLWMLSKITFSILLVTANLFLGGCASFDDHKKGEAGHNVLEEMSPVIESSNNHGHMYP